jgi:leucyl aminopeptidase (aminopeptidase T)
MAMTEFSATAPLMEYSEQIPNFRAASMPRVHQGMMETAMAADYQEVARKCQVLGDKLDRAEGAMLVFSTGDQVLLDLRNRQAKLDDGHLHADKRGVRLINLPSGEAFLAPYEGELSGQTSLSEGVIPMSYEGVVVQLQIIENQVVEVVSDSQVANELREWFAVDTARRNVAELGLGCNDKAIITGNILEDEKVFGVHLAYGRSDHTGGVVGVDDFSDTANVVHQDVVYPFGGEIEVTSLILEYEDGTSEEIISDGAYTIFSD